MPAYLTLTERAKIKGLPPEKALAYFTKLYPDFKNFYDVLRKQGYTAKELKEIILTYLPTKPKSITEYFTYPFLSTYSTYKEEVGEALKDIKSKSPLKAILGTLRYVGAPFTAITRGLIAEPIGEAYKVGGLATPKQAETLKTAVDIGASVLLPAGITRIPKIKKIAETTLKARETLKTEVSSYQKFLKLLKENPEFWKLPEKEQRNLAKAYGLTRKEVEFYSKVYPKEVLPEEIRKRIEELTPIIKIKLTWLEKVARPELVKVASEMNAIKAKYIDEVLDATKKITKIEDFVPIYKHMSKEMQEKIGSYWRIVFERYPLLKVILFTPEELSELLTIIRATVRMPFDEMRLIGALIDVFEKGKPLKPAEAKLLALIFDPSFAEQLNKISRVIKPRSTLNLLSKAYLSTVTTHVTLRASSDLSYLLRQARALVGTKEFWKNIVPSIRAFFDERYYVEGLAEILKDEKMFKIARAMGVDFTLPGIAKEEFYLAEKIKKLPIIGDLVAGSERAFVFFLNKVRFDCFKNGYRALMKMNLPEEEMTKHLTLLAENLNIWTGRGTWKWVARHGDLLRLVLWAPRLYTAQLQQLNVLRYVKMHPVLRQKYLFSALGGLALNALLDSLIFFYFRHLLGYKDVEIGLNPLSADFGRIRIGDTRIDFLGGLNQYVVLISRLLSGRYISSLTGKETEFIDETEIPIGKSRGDILWNFIRNKFNPTLDLIFDWFKIAPTPFEERTPAKDIFLGWIPLIFEDIIDLVGSPYREIEPTPVYLSKFALGMGASIIGGTVLTYSANDQFKPKTVSPEQKYQVDTEMRKHGLLLSDKFYLVYGDMHYFTLTEDVKNAWIQMYADIFYDRAHKMINDPRYQELGPIEQRNALKALAQKVKVATKEFMFGPRGKFGDQKGYFYNALYKTLVDFMVRNKYFGVEVPEEKALQLARKKAKEVVREYLERREREVQALLDYNAYLQYFKEER